MRTLLGIDIGTSACKVALFDENGELLASTSKEYPVYHPHPGWAEQDPNEWWEAVCSAIRETISVSGIAPGEIAGIGIDGQSWSAVAVDRDGQVLTNTPIWMDTRADDICQEWERTVGAEKIFALCKNPVKPSYTTPKILWYQRNLPEIYNKTFQILQSNSFIAYRLTGVFSQDLSQGYGLHCFDMAKGCFDPTMCELLGIDAGLLPPVFACHAIAGHVTEAAAALTGLAAGTPVAAGGLDAACGTLGAGVVAVGDTQEQGGQAGGMSICLDKPLADERLILSFHVVPDRWLLQGGTVGGGGIMRWIEQELGGPERLQAAGGGKNAFMLLDELAAEVPAGCEGLLFLPYMSGERSPIWDKDACGVFFGLDYAKTRAHMVRAALEGAVYVLRHDVDMAAASGAEVDVLRAMGGAANSRFWTQMKADITGKVIKVPSSDTSTTWGAAILAGVGTGVFGSFDAAVEKTIHIKREHIPDPARKAVYDETYRRYLKLYPALKELMRDKN